MRPQDAQECQPQVKPPERLSLALILFPSEWWCSVRLQFPYELSQFKLQLPSQLFGLLDVPAGSHSQELPLGAPIFIRLGRSGSLKVEVRKHGALSAAMFRAELMAGGGLGSGLGLG
jgi:hypothetical protein